MNNYTTLTRYKAATPRSARRQKGYTVPTISLPSGNSVSLGGVVMLSGEQTITSIKDFLAGIKVGGLSVYKSQADTIYLDANLVVRGAVTMYGDNGTTVPSIFEALPIDGATLKRTENGVLYVDTTVVGGGGGTGGGISIADVESYLTTNGYATQDWVTGKGYITGITSSMVTNALGYTPLSTSGGTITGDFYIKKPSNATIIFQPSNAAKSFWFGVNTSEEWFCTNGGYTETYKLIHSGNYRSYPVKNPNALSWSGYSSGSYDGSTAQSITIPNNTNQLTNGAGFITASASITGNAATATSAEYLYQSNIQESINYKRGADHAIKVVNCTSTKLDGFFSDYSTVLSVASPLSNFQIGMYANPFASKREHVRFRAMRNTDGTWTDWKALAFVEDLSAYLPLTGGTISQSGFWSTKFKSTEQTSSGIAFEVANGNVGYLMYADGSKWLATAQNWSATYVLLHSGNYSDYALPKDGTAVAANRLVEEVVTDLNNATAGRIFTMTSGYGSTAGNKPTEYWATGLTLAYAQNGAYRRQLAFGGASDESLYLRAEHIGVWGEWSKILTSSNFYDYALPLTGGKINGDLEVAGCLYSSGGNLRIRPRGASLAGVEIAVSDTDYWQISHRGSFANNELHFYHNANGTWSNSVLSLSVNGDVVTGNNLLAKGAITMYYSSDKRLKQNIRKINASEVLMSLGGIYQYEYIDSEVAKNSTYGGSHFGLIYQNVKGSALDKMCHEREDGYGALNYLDTNFISLIAGATMENISEIEQVKRENRELRKELEQLKQRVA